MADPSCGTKEAPFEAALVFTDPVDWYRDLQLLTDVIMSGQLLITFHLVFAAFVLSADMLGQGVP